MDPVSCSPPRAPPVKYATPLGTRWAREQAAAGGSNPFDLPTDPTHIGPWILGECVGKGASGRVKIAKHRFTGQLAAVKILPIAPLLNSRTSLATKQAKHDKQRFGIDREITMMKLMDHPNILRIYDVFEGEKELFLVLEYVEGGELFDFLVNRGRLEPLEALVYFKQIIHGLNYAHTFSIIHRDLKPENILIHTHYPPLIKIADWGMAAFAPPSLQLETSCGSPHYASPEIANGDKYEGTATDIWSCGVILFALLTGRLPFDDKNFRSLLSKIKAGKYEMPAWVDLDAQDLISKMLVVDVRQRITIPEILQHHWLVSPRTSGVSYVPRDLIARTPPLPPTPETLARPIGSPGLIDPELLASLRIIWGRHAEPTGDCIIRDLCSPVGEGTLAKAFYFLLGKYRERVRAEESRNETDNFGLALECQAAFWKSGTESFGNSFVSPAVADFRTRVKDGARKLAPTSLSQSERPRRFRTHTSNYPPESPTTHPAYIPSLPPPVVNRAATNSLPRDRPVSPAGPRPPSSSKIITRLHRPLGQTTHLEVVRSPGAALSRLPSPSQRSPSCLPPCPPRPPAPRRGYTYPYHPQQDEKSGIQFPAQSRNKLQRQPSNNYHSSQLKSSTIRPTSEDIHSPSPRYVASPVLPPILAPRTSNLEVQKAIDEITSRVNGLVARDGIHAYEPPSTCETRLPRPSVPSNNLVPCSKPVNRPASRYERLQYDGQDKENMNMGDDGCSIVGADGQPEATVELGLPDKVSENALNVKGKGVTVKPRLQALEPSVIHRNQADTLLVSPILLSPPSMDTASSGPYSYKNRFSQPHTTSTSRLLTSPVVGEVKGWFSNLFNWKTVHMGSDQLHGISSTLHSFDNIDITHRRIGTILEDLGVIMTEKFSADHEASVWIIQCRLDETGLQDPRKSVRFRVEIRTTCLHPQLTRLHDLDLHSTPTSVTPYRGRTNVSKSQHTELPLGCLSIISLVYEKGSVSTFKLVSRSLRTVYENESSSRSRVSDYSPMGNTPLPNYLHTTTI